MNVDVYNQQGEKKGQVDLPKEIFYVKINPDLIYQVVMAQRANRRQVIAHAKDRSEKRGGGKKPWRQKGTGRARHGSIRSPIWKGGGVTFGPTKARNFKEKVNRKMRRKALFMVLSAKAKNNLILVLDDLRLKHPKTKLMASMLSKLKGQGLKNVLIVLPNVDKGIVLAARNIPKTAIAEARNLNALDLLSFRYLVMPKQSIKVIRDTFLLKNGKSAKQT